MEDSSVIEAGKRIAEGMEKVEVGAALASLAIAEALIKQRAKVYSSHLPYLGGDDL